MLVKDALITSICNAYRSICLAAGLGGVKQLMFLNKLKTASESDSPYLTMLEEMSGVYSRISTWNSVIDDVYANIHSDKHSFEIVNVDMFTSVFLLLSDYGYVIDGETFIRDTPLNKHQIKQLEQYIAMSKFEDIDRLV